MLPFCDGANDAAIVLCVPYLGFFSCCQPGIVTCFDRASVMLAGPEPSFRNRRDCADRGRPAPIFTGATSMAPEP